MSTRDEVAARWVKLLNTHKTAQSIWTDFQALADWGWTFNDDAAYQASTHFYKANLDPVMKDLDLPELYVDDHGGSVDPRYWKHDRPTTHDDVSYPATQAHFNAFMDVEHGLIIVLVSYGPRFMAQRQNPEVTVLPKLRTLSDLLYLDYANRAAEKNVPVDRLKYYIVDDIRNDETKTAVEFALGATITALECQKHTWDKKKTFRADSEAYQALIASPSGRSAALILATHKNTLGQQRMIENIVFWCHSPTDVFFDLLFIKKDYDEPENDN